MRLKVFVLLIGEAFALTAVGNEFQDGIIRPSNKPNAVQQQMINRKYGMFIHFGMNTFHDEEWTDGKKPAMSYQPTALDTDQWVRTAKDAGMKYVIFTSKHHDGFCLWDSPYTEYDVGSSPNKTDVVAALARSCKKYGIQMGLYYSLWDRHEPAYGDDQKYVEYMLKQLTELLTKYGPVCELWLDGGWQKSRDKWDIPAVYALVKSLQPNCAVGVNWSIGLPENPDVRRVEPKDQKEGYPIRYFPCDFRLGDPRLPASPDPKLFSHNGELYYLPFEATVCLNKNWFFNTTDTHLKTLDELESIYKRATAQDNILILNSPPNRDGVMTEANVKQLEALAEKLGFLAQAQMPAALMVDSSSGPIRFGAGDVKAALEQNGYAVTTLPLGDPSRVAQSVRIILTTQSAVVPGMPMIAGITNQGYAIQKVVEGSATNWWVVGSDAPGVMYGGLDLAESVNLAKGLSGVTNRQVNPYMTQRGIKFNIPLDARSPSYSDDATSAQANITNVWELSFWEDYFDSMARNRYNLLSLWNLHPFPSMVRVPEYPNAALADVKMKTGSMWNATLNGMKMYDDEWELTTVKTMTVDEKIAFWRWVMQQAQDRGIQLYVFTWNIFVHGTESSGYGITDKMTNATTTDYFRKSVKAMFNTYPLLAGIGLTTGENMGGRTTTTAEKEQWAWDTYGQGIADAVADSKNPESPYYAPNRVIRLIHRLHQTEPAEVASFFQGLPGVNDADSTLSFSSKYNKAHMLSTTRSAYSDPDIAALPPGMKTFLTLRNDDLYYMRWGDPDFVREYIVNIPHRSKIAGYYMGPDGYTWGREYVSTEPDTPRQLVMDKMWYYFSLFGRLSFDPTIPNSRFEAILAERFPEVPSSNLFQGWASVSKVIPLINRFYWGSLDFHWYPEACWSSLGFHSVSNFITKYKPMTAKQTHEKPYFMSVEEYVKGNAAKGRLNPLEVADLLQQHADAGLASVQSLNPGSNKELRLTLGDIKAQAWLGRYYAEKIRGAVALHRYQTTGEASYYAEARTHLTAASNHWKEYAALWSAQYTAQVLGRMESALPLSIAELQAAVDADIPPPL